MASVGSFGVSSPTGNQINRNTSQSADKSQLLDSEGTKLEQTTHGSEIEVSEEFFAGATLPLESELEAVDGQNGTDVVTAHALNEVNNDYAKITKTTSKVPGSA